MTDRIPGAPGQYKAVVTQEELQKLQSSEEFTITMTRDDQPITEGTPYSKAAVLPDALAQQICPDVEDPSPADALAALRNMIYPVGAVYISVTQVDPAALFGGTWEQLKDRFLLGAGDTYAAGATGGEAAHTLTTAETPNHSHSVTVDTATSWRVKYTSALDTANGTTGGAYLVDDKSLTSGLLATSVSGSGNAHNNMPPYLAVYMWKRVA